MKHALKFMIPASLLWLCACGGKEAPAPPAPEATGPEATVQQDPELLRAPEPEPVVRIEGDVLESSLPLEIPGFERKRFRQGTKREGELVAYAEGIFQNETQTLFLTLTDSGTQRGIPPHHGHTVNEANPVIETDSEIIRFITVKNCPAMEVQKKNNTGAILIVQIKGRLNLELRGVPMETADLAKVVESINFDTIAGTLPSEP